MGVSIECGDVYVKCPYSFLHCVRRKWFDATVEYLEELETVYDTEGRDTKSALLNQLNSVYATDDARTADENYLQDMYAPLTSALTEFGLVGLYWFINASDSEGSFSVGQALDICDTLERISLTDDEYYHIFKKAVHEHSPVTIS